MNLAGASPERDGFASRGRVAASGNTWRVLPELCTYGTGETPRSSRGCAPAVKSRRQANPAGADAKWVVIGDEIPLLITVRLRSFNQMLNSAMEFSNLIRRSRRISTRVRVVTPQASSGSGRSMAVRPTPVDPPMTSCRTATTAAHALTVAGRGRPAGRTDGPCSGPRRPRSVSRRNPSRGGGEQSPRRQNRGIVLGASLTVSRRQPTDHRQIGVCRRMNRLDTKTPYVDGPRLAREFRWWVGSLALICPVSAP